jgi:hypothetical protein
MDIKPTISLRRACQGEEKLWRVWWQWGIPLGLLLNVLTVLAEASRTANHPAAGDTIDIVKLLFFFAWCRLAWRCAKNTDRKIWSNLARLTILLGFGIAAVTA